MKEIWRNTWEIRRNKYTRNAHVTDRGGYLTKSRFSIPTNHSLLWQNSDQSQLLVGNMKEYEGVMKEIWRNMKEIWRNMKKLWNMRKYEEIRGNMREYEEICLGPFSLNQSGASIFLEPSLWTNQEPAFSVPFSLNQSEASVFLSTNQKSP